MRITWGRAARAGACPPPEPGAEPHGAQPPARISARPPRAARGERCHRRGRQPPERGLRAHRRAPPARKRDRFLLRGSDTLRPPLKQMMSGWVMVHSGKPSPIHTFECTTGSARPAPAIHSWHQNRSRNSKPEFRSPRFPSLISPNTAHLCQGAKLK